MGFSACHPAINLIYFICMIVVTLCVPHPAFLIISFICAFAYSVKLNKLRGLIFSLCLIPCIAAFAWFYSRYTHFGITILGINSIGNNITLESIVYGVVMGGMVASVLIWFSCVHAVFTTDKVVYLFGKVSPRLSLFLAILLRIVPRIKGQAKKINTAQKCIGRGTNQGNALRRFINCIRIFSMLITWTIETMATASDSMVSRGSSLRGRTAFSIYRFDNRDRTFVILLFTGMTVLAMGLLLQQGAVDYDPMIRMNPVTPLSVVFYLGYALLCLLPLFLDIITEANFRKARQKYF